MKIKLHIGRRVLLMATAVVILVCSLFIFGPALIQRYRILNVLNSHGSIDNGFGHLEGSGVTDADIHEIDALTWLRGLNISHNPRITSTSLLPIGRIPHLEYLNISSTSICGGFSALKNTSRLKYFIASELEISDVDLEELSAPLLEHIDVSNTRCKCRVNLFRRGNGIVELNVSGSGVDDASLAYWGLMPRLQTLRLGGSAITDDGVSQLSRYTQIEVLDLSETNVGDNGVKSLVHLKHLQIIVLDSTHVTMNGIAAVAELPSVRYISVRRVPIKQDDLFTLRNRFAQIRIEQ